MANSLSTNLDAPQVIQSVYDPLANALRTSGGGYSSSGLTDVSGATSGTPGTSTVVAAADPNRKYFIIQNVDASNTLYVNFGAAATAASGSFKLTPASSMVFECNFITTQSINVVSSSASVAYTAKVGV